MAPKEGDLMSTFSDGTFSAEGLVSANDLNGRAAANQAIFDAARVVWNVHGLTHAEVW